MTALAGGLAALVWSHAAVAENAPPPRPKPRVTAEKAPIESASVPSIDDGDAEVLRPPRAKPREVSPSRYLSREDFVRLRVALADARDRDIAEATEEAAKLPDPDIRDLVEWVALRSAPTEAGYDRIAAFLNAHPLWPERDRLRAGAEKALHEGDADAGTVVAYFRSFPPVTGLGKLMLANAYVRSGDKDRALHWYARAWREDELDASLERLALERCSDCISDALDKERLDRMAYRGHYSAAKRAAKRLGKDLQLLTRARQDLDRRSRRADRRYAQVPKKLKDDPGLNLSRVTWLRRKDRDEDARKILLAAPSDPAKLLELDAWWTERRLVARRALGQGKAEEAYRIAAGHGMKQGSDFAEGEFLAGWIALRHLKKPEVAKRHFERLRGGVVTPISIARGEYWLARAEAALGNREAEHSHLARAAKNGTVFYGQLAREKLKGSSAMLHLPAEPIGGPGHKDERVAVLVKGAEVLAAAGERWLAAVLASQAARSTDDPATIARLANFANVLALPQVAIRIAKAGLATGAPLHAAAFPVLDYPKLSDDPSVEPALLYALTRQESEFNWQASSHAGARGLMQIMPRTGRMLARMAGVSFSLKRLGEDPEYNASLGARYLTELLDKFGGSYILAVASYNAGPGRIDDWIEEYGDPRDPAADPIDWIETIPYNETRNYVQRVLENLQVYRARLANGAASLHLAEDLRRGRARYADRSN